MKMQWSTFEGRPFGYKAKREVRVTLGQKGVFYLNGVAYDALGQPAAVEILYEGNRRIIGLKPVDLRKHNAFPIKIHGTGTYKRISAAAFCQHFRIKLRETVLFDGADLNDEGVMLLDMNRTITVGRGAR